MTKKLNTDTITSELEGSAFFPSRTPAASPMQEASEATPPPPASSTSHARPSRRKTSSTNEDASTLASNGASLIETIRHVVKDPGKEVSFVRLSPAEKERLVDLVYAFKRQGKKTSETEINRIAVNFILEDYRINGDDSVLAQVLEALRA